MDAGFEKGREPPKWYTDEPHLSAGQAWYVKAFWDLDSERQLGMSLGRIPRTCTRKYGSEAGLCEDMIEVLWCVIQALDAAYLPWVVEQQKKESGKAGKPGIGNRRVNRG